METDQPYLRYHQWHRKLNITAAALIFITVGILFLARNLGWMGEDVFRVLVSWKMLLIVIGLVQLIKKHFIAGLVLLAVGSYFLVPVPGVGMYWPVFLIVIGIGILARLRKPHGHWHHFPHHHHHHHHHGFDRCAGFPEDSTTEDGFVKSDVTFGGARYIVLDPVFRGGDLDTTFGHIMLDLRRTNLEAEETFIDVDCTFSGIDLFIPSSWNIVVDVDNTFGSCEDKRLLQGVAVDEKHKLIIRGDITCGGIEIKN